MFAVIALVACIRDAGIASVAKVINPFFKKSKAPSKLESEVIKLPNAKTKLFICGKNCSPKDIAFSLTMFLKIFNC